MRRCFRARWNVRLRRRVSQGRETGGGVTKMDFHAFAAPRNTRTPRGVRAFIHVALVSMACLGSRAAAETHDHADSPDRPKSSRTFDRTHTGSLPDSVVAAVGGDRIITASALLRAWRLASPEASSDSL